MRTFLQDPAALDAYGPLHTTNGLILTPSHIRVLNDDMVVARFREVNDRTGAEALNGQDLIIDRERLPEIEEEEYYHADLIGLRAQTIAGDALGVIAAIHNFGAGDVLEVRGPMGQAYYPFTKLVVPVIDVSAGQVTIAPPDETSGEDQG